MQELLEACIAYRDALNSNTNVEQARARYYEALTPSNIILLVERLVVPKGEHNWLKELVFRSYNWQGSMHYSVDRFGEGNVCNPRFDLDAGELRNALKTWSAVVDASKALGQLPPTAGPADLVEEYNRAVRRLL